MDGKLVDADYLKGKWTFVSNPQPGRCAQVTKILNTPISWLAFCGAVVCHFFAFGCQGDTSGEMALRR